VEVVDCEIDELTDTLLICVILIVNVELIDLVLGGDVAQAL
jgi:hypothetical protein